MADPMSRDEIDDELRRLTEQYDRIAASVLELEEHQGRKLLDGARLAGITESRWTEAAGAYTDLWAHLDAYRETLRRAATLRGEGSRLSRADAGEISRLLREPALAVPTARGTRLALGAAGSTRIGFGEAVTRMAADYQTVVEVADAADAVWSRLLPPIEAAREQQRRAADLAASLGLDADSSPEAADLAGAGEELARLHESVRADPLASWSGRLASGAPIDPPSLPALTATLEAATRALVAASRVRDEAAQRIDRLGRAIDELAASETELSQSRARVAARISRPEPPEAPQRANTLRASLGDLNELLRAAGAGAGSGASRWERLDERLGAAERAVADATSAAADCRDALAGLLGRRDELRGLLGAYRARAARLGVGEHQIPAAHYQRARDLLWTAPCDLDEAAAEVQAFRAALSAPTASQSTDYDRSQEVDE
jgi:hypothetical protein